MSRALARVRETVGDPILVKAGRKLLRTPRATERRDRVDQLIQEVQAVLLPTNARQTDKGCHRATGWQRRHGKRW